MWQGTQDLLKTVTHTFFYLKLRVNKRIQIVNGRARKGI